MDKQIYETPVSLLSTSVWLSVPKATRDKLAQLFELKRSGDTQVDVGAEGARILSDGYTGEDLMKISTASMQKLLNSNSTDFYQLFQTVVENIDELVDGGIIESGVSTDVEMDFVDDNPHETSKAVVEAVDLPKKRGRPAKSA